MTNDTLIFAPEDSAKPARNASARHPWRVAIIDDAPEVHSVTRMVLKDVCFRGRNIEFFDAFSAAEGKRVLAEVPDLAVVFLDVVMENDHAGLELVEYIRNELHNKDIRIILRTGQPGQAPEAEVIVKYDINDYKHKSELSAEKLFTTLIAALRSYQDLMTIETSRMGLENILHGTAELFQNKSTDQFLSGVLIQLNAIFQLGQDALLYVRNVAPGKTSEKVMAASGKYLNFVGLATTYYEFPGAVREAVGKALEAKASCYEPDRFLIYFYSGNLVEIVVYIDVGRELNALDTRMIDIFCSNVSVGLANVQLLETLENRVVERTRELASAYTVLEQSKQDLEKVNETLRMMSITDPLTGVFNRRHLLDVAAKLFNSAMRYGWELSVLLIDIDHFKLVNDTYGHAAGDRLLQEFAKAINASLRDSDVFGRIGGEEFVVVAPHAGLDAAKQLAERLQERVAQIDLKWDGPHVATTMSIGITLCDAADTSIQAPIERADAAMYMAKQQGRNRIIVNQVTPP
jgi:diguanylate cyclase (GGDEF)-like protein